MKIGRYEFRVAQVQIAGRMRGYISVPRGARVTHYGVAPDLKGNLCAWTEESSIQLAVGKPEMETREFLLLKHGDEIPAGHTFVGHILAAPILLVYEHTGGGEDKSKVN